MYKGLWITVLIVFALFFGLFLFSQIPVAITQDEVSTAVSDAIAETNAQVDEMEIEQLVIQKAVEKLEVRQKKAVEISRFCVFYYLVNLQPLRLTPRKNAKPIA